MSKDRKYVPNEKILLEMFKIVKELNHAPTTTDSQRGEMIAILGQAVNQYTSKAVDDPNNEGS